MTTTRNGAREPLAIYFGSSRFQWSEIGYFLRPRMARLELVLEMLKLGMWCFIRQGIVATLFYVQWKSITFW